MKPLKQAVLNTIGYIVAFVLVWAFAKHSIDWGAGLIHAIVYFALNYVLLSAIHYANKK